MFTYRDLLVFVSVITRYSRIVMTAKWKPRELLCTSSLVASVSSSNTVLVLLSLAVAADAGGDMAGTMTTSNSPQTLQHPLVTHAHQCNPTCAFKPACPFRHAFWNRISSLTSVCNNLRFDEAIYASFKWQRSAVCLDMLKWSYGNTDKHMHWKPDWFRFTERLISRHTSCTITRARDAFLTPFKKECGLCRSNWFLWRGFAIPNWEC